MTDAYSRQRKTSIFRGRKFLVWRGVIIVLIGCGNLGGRLGVALVRSGARIWACDVDKVEAHDQLLYAAPLGTPKVEALIAECERIHPGSASGYVGDIRHVGIGRLRRSALVINTTDDPLLDPYVTGVANFLGIPSLRVAVDGSGQRELGRVLYSDPRNGGACLMCSFSQEDLWKLGPRTPCPGAPAADRPSTITSGALSSAVCAVAEIQAQRARTKNDFDLVRNREVFLDLSGMQIMSMVLPRSENCLAGHERWELTEVSSARVPTLRDLFNEAESRLGNTIREIEPFAHPLCLEAGCACGNAVRALGTVYADRPVCDTCHEPMTWRPETQLPALNRPVAEELQALDRPLRELGFPVEGPLFTAYSDGRPPLRLLLTEET